MCPHVVVVMDFYVGHGWDEVPVGGGKVNLAPVAHGGFTVKHGFFSAVTQGVDRNLPAPHGHEHGLADLAVNQVLFTDRVYKLQPNVVVLGYSVVHPPLVYNILEFVD